MKTDRKIIQLLLTPNDETWQGVILGLGNDGITYVWKDCWIPYLPPISEEVNP